jgi:hypothetical protein
MSALLVALATTTVLMLCLFALSNLILYRGLLPLATSVPFPRLIRPMLYLLIMPGTVVHEFSHWAACVLTRVRVFEVHLFDPRPDGVVGQVVYAPCDPLRRNIIALAPFVGGSAALWAASRLVFAPTASVVSAALPVRPEFLVSGIGALIGSVAAAVATIDLTRGATWLGLYLVFSLGYGVAPSRTDLSRLVTDGALALGIGLTIYACDTMLQLGLSANGLVTEIAGALSGLLAGLNSLLAFSVVILAMSSAVVIPVAAVIGARKRR